MIEEWEHPLISRRREGVNRVAPEEYGEECRSGRGVAMPIRVGMAYTYVCDNVLPSKGE